MVAETTSASRLNRCRAHLNFVANDSNLQLIERDPLNVFYVGLNRDKPPFDDEKPMRVIIAHAHQPPQPPSQLNPAIPDDLEMIVMRCLHKSPQDRYPSAAELVAALEDCDDHGAGSPYTLMNRMIRNATLRPIPVCNRNARRRSALQR